MNFNAKLLDENILFNFKTVNNERIYGNLKMDLSYYVVYMTAHCFLKSISNSSSRSPSSGFAAVVSTLGKYSSAFSPSRSKKRM